MNLIPRNALTVFIAGAAIVATGILLLSIAVLERNTIEYHVWRLNRLKKGPFLPPKAPGDFLQARTLRWFMYGRPTYQEWGDELEQHQQALIRLEFYQRRWLEWHDRDPTWESAFTNTAVWKARYTLHGDFTRASEIRVTARPEDILEFEKVVQSQHSKRNDTAQPDGSAYRSQPIGSETNRTSAAAGSGR